MAPIGDVTIQNCVTDGNACTKAAAWLAAAPAATISIPIFRPSTRRASERVSHEPSRRAVILARGAHGGRRGDDQHHRHYAEPVGRVLNGPGLSEPSDLVGNPGWQAGKIAAQPVVGELSRPATVRTGAAQTSPNRSSRERLATISSNLSEIVWASGLPGPVEGGVRPLFHSSNTAIILQSFRRSNITY